MTVVTHVEISALTRFGKIRVYFYHEDGSRDEDRFTGDMADVWQHVDKYRAQGHVVCVYIDMDLVECG